MTLTAPMQNLEVKELADTSKLPQPSKPPILTANFKTMAQDFIVEELLDIEFSNSGEHLWLQIQKQNLNTAFVAQMLANWAQIPLKDVGYSGIKDRKAQTTQWFSLRLPKKEVPALTFTDFLQNQSLNDGETLTILAQQWHLKKLNRGTHQQNRFTIVLREVSLDDKDNNPAAKDAVLNQLNAIAKSGVPNYFGTQRFGIEGNNIANALQLFAKPLSQSKTSNSKSGKKRRLPTPTQSLAISAARSAIFNQILAARVIDGSWNQGKSGEIFNLAGSGSIFVSYDIDEEIQERLACHDIHPTGALWGTPSAKTSAAIANFETEVIQKNALLSQLAAGLERFEVKSQRRTLRLTLSDFKADWLDDKTIMLSFSLPKGSFATSVLASLVQTLTQPNR
ncbi:MULTISPECIES: tRNA pseudouridine(13) synthase TruD [Psychrobacter]|uniref:tRNA pseudouridine(13) synthase TruD n=1 Tax=Psychrobacter TaxID=497 RepID=UPI00146A348E|nr:MULTISPECIES: tRNA pseudouridine(13) synthase TruD [Psychrobacter]